MRAWRNWLVNPSEVFEEHLAQRIRDYAGSPAVADMLAYHFGYPPHGPARRGKRLRPKMLMSVCETEGGTLERALDAAAAVEILHNYSLAHDDIEDRDEFRRGRRTLWSVYGIAQAINAGDAMCALSVLALVRVRSFLGAARTLEMVERLHRAHRTMCNGQSLDLQFERAGHVELSAYYEMIGGKTAALFEAACALGACAAGVPDAADAYAELGHAYGIAFQIRDDALGIWASADRTGKAVAGDLLRRKWTFPIAWALAGPPSPARAVIADAYRLQRPLDSAEAERVAAALESVGAREAATRAVEEPMAVVERCPNRLLRDYLLETLAEPVG
ncbi:MAG TPA: polyprenyl synthetase family protein [Candidatus Baltobacteraceae bacterium]|nr:polyprenyl synthetase family protein [Candidatus Baltobacteraceae bacterium]